MARSTSQIYAELEALAHPLFVETAPGRALLSGLARVLAVAESAWDGVGGWLEQLFRQTATGDWLDLHGELVGVPRRGGEDDETYRGRAVARPTELTRAAVDGLVQERAGPHGDGYDAVITEPYEQVLDEGCFLDTAHAQLTPPIGEPGRSRYLAWVHLPQPDVRQPVDGAAIDASAFLDEGAHLGEDILSMERPWLRGLIDLLRTRRPLGVGYGYTVDDLWQDAYLPLLV